MKEKKERGKKLHYIQGIRNIGNYGIKTIKTEGRRRGDEKERKKTRKNWTEGTERIGSG